MGGVEWWARMESWNPACPACHVTYYNRSWPGDRDGPASYEHELGPALTCEACGTPFLAGPGVSWRRQFL